MEAERVGGEDVEQQAGEHRRDARARRGRRDPVRQREPRRAAARAPATTRSAPQTPRPTAISPGNHAGPNFWPGIAGKPLDVPEDDRGERDQRRAGQRVVDLYLASPTALSAAPRFVSESAMNFVVPAGSAHTTPKPRLAMKSLYSFES